MSCERPQRAYRARFRELLLGDEPQSVLDVGCGGGTMLRWFRERDRAIEGLEADAGLVEQLCADGHIVHHGRGEELPFGDSTFDLVASEYCAHHFADLARHLTEARRVARTAVWLLDPWYETSLPSQRRTLRWDSWCKRIDRRLGRVHSEVLSVADFLAAMPDVVPSDIDFQHWLRLVPVDAELFESESAEHLALANAEERAEFDAIRAELDTHGMTDDGAIVVRVAVG